MQDLFIELLEKDYENWVLYDNAWKLYWGENDNTDYHSNMLFCENKGFILLKDYRCSDKTNCIDGCKIHIQFAYVSSKYRKQGILRKLIKKLEIEYKGEHVSLASLNKVSSTVWEKIGFKLEKTYVEFADEYKLEL